MRKLKFGSDYAVYRENNSLNRIIILTYKSPHAHENERFGFEARIQEITVDNLVILQKLNDPAPCDLRGWPRIRLDVLPSVRAFCHDKEIQVIDISGDGTHIILQENEHYYIFLGGDIKHGNYGL